MKNNSLQVMEAKRRLCGMCHPSVFTKVVWSVLIMLLNISIVSAADVKIKGNVKDVDGKPIIGASIVVKGGTAGTTSDMNGNYVIDVKDAKAVLKYSFIGYQASEAIVGNRNVINIILNEDATELDDVVVIGYGTMKKRDLSGSVGQIKGDELLKSNPTSINQALQGKMAGVQVNQNDGAPGAGVSIQIRGANSFTTDTQPLYIVDGIPFEGGSTPTSNANENNNQTSNPMSLINPNDIASIEVLKDASATAIYGSRGSNGVILITTKKGDGGDTKVEFSSNFSFSKLGKKIDMLNGYEFALFGNEATKNAYVYDGQSWSEAPFSGIWKYNGGDLKKGKYYPKPEDYLNPGMYTDSNGNEAWVQGTNWQNEIYQNSSSQEYNLSVVGGNDRGHFAFSGNYSTQDGIIKNSGYERLSTRANISRKVYNWLDMGLNLSFTRSATDFSKTNSQDYSIIRSAMLYPSTIYVGDNTTDDELTLLWLSANPATYVNEAKDRLESTNVFNSAYAEIKFTNYLKFRQNFGMSYYNHDRGTYYSRLTGEGRGSNGRGGQSNRWGTNTTVESMLTFDKTFNKKHNLNAVAVFAFEKAHWGSKSMSASQFPTDLTQDYNLGLGLVHDRPSTDRGQSSLVSLLGRVNYIFNGKYIVTASFRRDGSSRFAEGNKFANFASGAIAWRISDEQLIKDLNIFSNLKLRASYGQTGSQSISPYSTLAELNVGNYPLGGTLNSGVVENLDKGPINIDLMWETTDQYNVGLDVGVLDGKINFTADYYFKKTRDLLQNVKIAPSTGYYQQTRNSAHVTNEGLELSGQFYIFTKGDFKWDVNANISFNRNKIGGLGADRFATRLWSGYDNVFIQRNHCPIGAIYGFVEDGFYDNEAEVRADPAYTAASSAEVLQMIGEVKYRDFDGKAGITEDDKTIIGDTNPDFIYGITSNMTWKNITFSFFLQGVQGNDIFNANNTNITMHSSSNITKDAFYSRWTPENAANARWPRATSAQNRLWRTSDRYVEDGSYLKLKSINLGYNFYPKFKGVSCINVFASATNLFTITGYSWFDPDVNAFGGDVTRRGVDLYSYPSSRTFSVGLKLTF